MGTMTNDIKIVKGKTFRDVIRWESAPVIYKAITGIALARNGR